MYLTLLKHYLKRTLIVFIIIVALVPLYAGIILDVNVFTAILLSSYFVYLFYSGKTYKEHKNLSFLPVSRNKMILADYSAYTIHLIFGYIVVLSTFVLLKRMLTNPNLTVLKFPLGSSTAVVFSLALLGKCLFEFSSSMWLKALAFPLFHALGFFIVMMSAKFFAVNRGYSPDYILYPVSLIIISITFLVTKRWFPRLDL